MMWDPLISSKEGIPPGPRKENWSALIQRRMTIWGVLRPSGMIRTQNNTAPSPGLWARIFPQPAEPPCMTQEML